MQLWLLVNAILVVILNGEHETVSVFVVPLEHIASILQQKGDTCSVTVLSSNQKWRYLQKEVSTFRGQNVLQQ